jgi:hypothetical protein
MAWPSQVEGPGPLGAAAPLLKAVERKNPRISLSSLRDAAAPEGQPRCEAPIGGMAGFCTIVGQATTTAGSSVPRSGGSCHVAAAPALRVAPLPEGGVAPQRGLAIPSEGRDKFEKIFSMLGHYSAPSLVSQGFQAFRPQYTRHAKFNVPSPFWGSALS